MKLVVSMPVFGPRALPPHNAYPTERFRLGAYAKTITARMLYSCELTDQSTVDKAFITAFLKSLPLGANGFALCAEETAMTRKSGMDILETPIRYSKRMWRKARKSVGRAVWQECGPWCGVA